MREIKFRAFCEKHNRWEYYSIGDLICGEATSLAGEGGIFKSDTWTQFTGLKDKNGKEIYEGDIVLLSSDNDFPRIIEWHKIGFRVKQINSPNNFPLHYPFVGKNGYDTDWEIIGNIYENAELLK